MKWINANDRLPGWETPVRWRFDGYETANKETITEVAYRRPVTIYAHEWLDEALSSETASQKKIWELEKKVEENNEAVEFAEWMEWTNWKYTQSHGWYDPNEKYPKYFTTKDLLNIFKSLTINS